MSKKKRHDRLDKISRTMTEWTGTPTSVIVHTVLFIGIFGLVPLGVPIDSVLLILTTAVSLEAIYLAIFIQMSVNRQAALVKEVSEDIEDIQEDVEDVTEDIEDIQEDVEDLESNIDELSQDASEDDVIDERLSHALTRIEHDLKELHQEIGLLKKKHQGE